MKEEDYDGSDEELAPMVDGLSGTLCIIILVSMVFIFSGMKSVISYINYEKLNFESVHIDIKKRVIYFKGGINLQEDNAKILIEEFRNSIGDKIILKGYVDNKISESKDKNIYNLIYIASLIKNLELNKTILFEKGMSEYCSGWNSCIYWDYK
ncbi:hypothetical protein [Providencia rettgeri]|uniref:hypothetical protein n=1 Tax=Providencia rettgeri TaxID=587 RepID=UPI00384C3AF1